MAINIPPNLKLTNKVLKNMAKPVDFDNVRQNDYLAHKMLDFMLKNNGVGLAAPQVGISRRLFVMEVGRITYFIFNPVITRYGTDMIAGQEGCLSFPDEFITVPRSRDIYGTYQNFRGETIEFAFHGGLLSVCFQHEYDHLNGIVMHERAGVDRSTT